MPSATDSELVALIQELRAELRSLATRVGQLEQGPGAAALRPAAAAPAVPAVPAKPQASEEDMLVIAAAVAAFLGVKARIRQVRLIQSAAWAQVGRATIHASHRVH